MKKLDNIAEMIKWVWVPSLVSVGTVLNLLTIMVFCRRRMRKYCLSLSMICLAISDTTVLLVPVLFTWIDQVFYKYYFLNNTLWCNLHGYLDLVSSANSSWIIILISAERWYAVCKPWQKTRMFTNKRVALALIAIFAFSLVSFVYFPLSLHLETISNNSASEPLGHSPNRTECQVYSMQVYLIFGALSVMLVYVVPFFVLAYLNIMIIVRLRQRPLQKQMNKVKSLSSALRSNFNEMDALTSDMSVNRYTKRPSGQKNSIDSVMATPPIVSLSTPNTHQSRTDRNLSITLVTLAITFMILTFPFQVCWFYENVYKVFLVKQEQPQQKAAVGNGTATNTSSSSTADLINDITFKLKSLNYLINFFLYSALSKLFRHEFLAMISKNKCLFLGKLFKSLKAPSGDKLTDKNSSFAELSFSVEAFKNFKNGNFKKARQQLILLKIEPNTFFEYINQKKQRRASAPRKKLSTIVSSNYRVDAVDDWEDDLFKSESSLPRTTSSESNLTLSRLKQIKNLKNKHRRNDSDTNRDAERDASSNKKKSSSKRRKEKRRSNSHEEAPIDRNSFQMIDFNPLDVQSVTGETNKQTSD